VKIEIWADVICPWCGIGQHRLEQAVAQAGGDIEVVHRSFQLDPRHPEATRPTRELLEQKYRMSAAQAQQAFARVEGIAKDDGIVPYIVGENRVGNTRLAHELAAFASTQGKEDAAWKALYRAYFGEARSIFDVEALVTLAGEIGLDVAEARAALADGRFTQRVVEEQREAAELGATGVPFIVIDRRVGIAGAQPAATIADAIRTART
jgi:predicted DsbA family dithiol-disulfide isomerase